MRISRERRTIAIAAETETGGPFMAMSYGFLSGRPQVCRRAISCGLTVFGAYSSQICCINAAISSIAKSSSTRRMSDFTSGAIAAALRTESVMMNSSKLFGLPLIASARLAGAAG